MLYKVVLTFESVDEILKWCDHSNESYWAVLSCGAVIMQYKVVLTFESVDEILLQPSSLTFYGHVLVCITNAKVPFLTALCLHHFSDYIPDQPCDKGNHDLNN